MNRRKLIASTSLAFALFLGAASMRAQEPPPQEPPPPGQEQPPPDNQGSPEGAPKPAARSFPTPTVLYSDHQDDTNPNVNNYQADYTPLTGVQNATLGVPDPEHSYWVPGVQYAANMVSPQSNIPGSSWYVNNYVAANVSVLDTWSRSQLAINYSGGGYFSAGNGQGNGQFQNFGLSETYRGDRWNLQILEEFTFLPQSSYGFGGGTGLGTAGVSGSLGNTGGVPGLNSAYVPTQAYGGFGAQHMNVSALQFTYKLSRRSSFTVSGVYGLLTFDQPGQVGSNALSAGLGYNYQISRNDSIGVVYRFTNAQ